MPQLIPIVLAVSAVAGVGLSAYGGIEQSSASSKTASYQQQIAADEQRQEALRRQAMELDNHRRQLEAVRQQQRARASALSSATNQGAQFGSGLPGGYGQIGGQTDTQLLGLSQSLGLGRANFDINSDISGARYGISGASSQYSTGAGFSSLGGSILSSLGPIGNIAGGFNSAPSRMSYQSYGAGNYSYPVFS